MQLRSEYAASVFLIAQIKVRMSAFGTKRTACCRPAMSAFEAKADINHGVDIAN